MGSFRIIYKTKAKDLRNETHTNVSVLQKCCHSANRPNHILKQILKKDSTRPRNKTYGKRCERGFSYVNIACCCWYSVEVCSEILGMGCWEKLFILVRIDRSAHDFWEKSKSRSEMLFFSSTAPHEGKLSVLFRSRASVSRWILLRRAVCTNFAISYSLSLFLMCVLSVLHKSLSKILLKLKWTFSHRSYIHCVCRLWFTKSEKQKG